VVGVGGGVISGLGGRAARSEYTSLTRSEGPETRGRSTGNTAGEGVEAGACLIVRNAAHAGDTAIGRAPVALADCNRRRTSSNDSFAARIDYSHCLRLPPTAIPLDLL